MRTPCLIIAISLCFFTQNIFGQNSLIVQPPVINGTSNPNHCYNATVNMVVPNGDSNLTLVPNSYFIWEYAFSFDGTSTIYNFLGNSYSATFSFLPSVSFSDNQISISQLRYLRVKQVIGTGPNPYIIGVSFTIPIMFSPSAPIFAGSASEILETTSSCIGTPTGTIKIPHHRFTDSILYIVKNSTNASFCNPFTNVPPCLDVIKSGKTADTNFIITGLPAGSYIVYIANTGGNFNVCNNASLAVISADAPLQINAVNAVNPACYNEANGKYELNVSGGDSTTYHFTILPNVGSKRFANGKVFFEDLPFGNYAVNLTDTCGAILNSTFTLTNPPKIVGTIAKIVPTCALPGNGKIKIFAKYNATVLGYNNFSYKLFKNGLCVDSLINVTDTIHEFNGLAPATYFVKAYSPNNPNCTGLEETFNLPINALNLNLDSLKNLNCNGVADGYIKVKAVGGSGSFLFFLHNINTGNTILDSMGIFLNLGSGTYMAVAKNRIGNCQDSAAINLTITQPTTLNVVVNKIDIQCYNYNNGNIIAQASGGIANYNYYWEKQNPISNVWISYFDINDTITNLYPGNYRSKIIDSRNCVILSSVVNILEPDSLVIDSVKVKDIPCLAGSGFITVYSKGGNANPIYQYRKLPSTSYVTFNSTTGLDAGSYLVRVVDSKNCTTNYTDTLIITSPPSNLDFTYNIADVNGYNITCYGADNGSIVISAFGGNGDGYIGYKYTFDTIPWQINNSLYNIPAGLRAIKVTDARGCIVTKLINFTQPFDSLQVQLKSKKNIACFDSSIGNAAVLVTGGVRPYRYSIDGGYNYQTDSNFINLAAGNYNVIIKDFNNCTGNIAFNITNINPVLQSVATVLHVDCNGNANGAINTSITGGVAPYSYSWVGNAGITNSLVNVVAGIYTQKITDAVGCIKEFNIAVNQPASLTPLVKLYPVCFGAANGKIIIKPIGGTAPYQYSINNGTSFQTDTIFNNLPQGSYNIVVKDSKNCTWNGVSNLGVISTNPNLNFIISSNQHAHDTVTMKEISSIKPDSIRWEFHPAAIIIDNNNLEPKIKFNNFDSTTGYWVRLIGFYPTCSYITEKVIKIYPYDSNAVITPASFNRGIKKAILFPNPNFGQFKLNLEFYKLQKATVFITNIQGVVIGQKTVYPASLSIEKNYVNEMQNAPPGNYIMRIVSDFDSRYILFIKQ